MASLVVARLSEFLFHEAEVLSTVESRVEDIRRELMLMKAFLKDIESGGEVQVEGFNKLMVDFNDVARDIDDAVETFLDISVRTTWSFSLVDRYKVGKEVERISERVREISKRMKLKHASGEAVETSRNATEEEAPAVEKLSYILREKLVADFEVKNVVEEVRDEVAGMENVVSDLKSKEQSNEREKVWLEEASNVSNFTVSVIEDFITRRRKSEGFPLLLGLPMRHLPAPLNWLNRFLTLPYWPFPAEEKLMKEMNYIKTQVQGALIRRLTYGVGEEDVGDQQIGSTPTIQITPLLSPLSLIEFYTLPIIVSMSTSPDQKLKPIQRELALMHAFFRDIRGVEGLNERQKVWVEQMKDTAQQAEALLAAYELKSE